MGNHNSPVSLPRSRQVSHFLMASSMDGKTKIAIIGTGFIANAHLNAAANLSDTLEIIGALSRNPDKLNDFCQKYKIRKFENIEDLVGKVGGVIIATPPAAHFDLIEKLINIGIKNIMCEKPMFVYRSDAIKIKEFAKSNQTFIKEAFTYRHSRGFEALRLKAHHLDGIDNIDINFTMNAPQNAQINWRNSKKDFGGVIYDFLIYAIDCANYFAKSRPIGLFAKADFCESKVCDKISVIIEYENRINANLHSSRRAGFNQSVKIGAKNGYLEMPFAFSNNQDWHLRQIETGEFIEYFIEDEIIHQNKSEFIDIPAFTAQLKSFADQITNPQISYDDLDKSVINCAVLDAIIKSVECGAFVKIEDPQ